MEDNWGKLKTIITDSIKFWEIGRLIYKGILALIVITFFIIGLMQGNKIKYLDISLFLFVMAVLANILYCFAYLVDVFVQLSAFQETWKKYRWLLLALGILLASVFAWLTSREMFIPRPWVD